MFFEDKVLVELHNDNLTHNFSVGTCGRQNKTWMQG